MDSGTIEFFLDHYSDTVLWKARYAVHNGHVQPDSVHAEVFWVKSSSGHRHYRVQLVGESGVACSCFNGMNLGGKPKCFHTAAALLVYRAQHTDEKDNHDTPHA